MKYNYKVKRQKFGPIKVEVQETNAKKETMVIALHECTNPGGKNSLSHLWYKGGWTETELETYLMMHTYVTDSEGNCRGAYSPTVKYSEEKKRFVLDFDWMLENTPENQEKLINEAVSRFRQPPENLQRKSSWKKSRSLPMKMELMYSGKFPPVGRKINIGWEIHMEPSGLSTGRRY